MNEEKSLLDVEKILYFSDINQFLRHKKKIKKQLLLREDFIEKKIYVLAGSTVGELENILELFLLAEGIRPIFMIGDFNRIYEEVFFSLDKIKAFNPDYIYIHSTYRNIQQMDLNGKNVLSRAESLFERFEQILNRLSDEINCVIIQNNFEYPMYRIFGNSDAYREEGEVHLIASLNEKLYRLINEKKNIFINDINYQSAKYGLDQWYDDTAWYNYQYPFAIGAMPLVARNLSGIIKASVGKSKKSFIVDLDNTLWGGVIGDIGENEVELSQTKKGRAYVDFQKYLKKLRNTGLILNVSSKNNYDMALKGFEREDSILKRDDFALFKANWNQKSENIKDIIQELNILEDSIVFIDDNPVERELIKQNFPQISVPEMDDVINYIRRLDDKGYVEVVRWSEEDKNRNEYYLQNIKRKESQSRYKDYNEYLKSLDMICRIDRLGDHNIERSVQLINKTNQFNVTGEKCSEDQLVDLATKNQDFSLIVSLEDRFGKNGIVSCFFGDVREKTLCVPIWVMSCRVFQRSLEETIFTEVVRRCKEKDLDFIEGVYIETGRNQYIKDLYEKLGFELAEKDGLKSIWKYELDKNKREFVKTMEVFCD